MKFLKLLAILFLFSNNSLSFYIVTAANAKYYPHLLNLIGSLHKENFMELTKLMVFDLGLESEQIEEIKKIDKLEVCDLKKIRQDVLKPVIVNAHGTTVPGGYAWKPVVIKQALETCPFVIWMDAGTTILKSIVPLAEYIKEHGYFLSTIGQEIENGGKFPHPIRWQTTEYIVQKFNLTSASKCWILEKEAVMAGLIGVARGFEHLFLNELYDLAHDMRNFHDDGSCPEGFGCYRYEQALLGIIAYSNNLKIFKHDYQQDVPMLLNIDGTNKPFYITWHPESVNGKTCIFNSRWYFNLESSRPYIRMK